MVQYVCNKEMEIRLQDLRQGLHTAMTALIAKRDTQETEVILRQMDEHMRVTYENLTVSR